MEEESVSYAKIGQKVWFLTENIAKKGFIVSCCINVTEQKTSIRYYVGFRLGSNNCIEVENVFNTKEDLVAHVLEKAKKWEEMNK